MKAKLFFIAAALMAATVAMANDDIAQKFAVVERGNGIFKVIYEGEKSGTVQMNILNRNGEVVLSKTLRHTNGFILPVNFSGMKPGDYTIQLVDASGKFSKTIQYANRSKVTGPAPVVHVTRLSRDNQYLMSISGNSPEKLDIRILDNALNTIYRETRVVDQAGIVFNLKELSGFPIFKVITESGEQVIVKK